MADLAGGFEIFNPAISSDDLLLKLLKTHVSGLLPSLQHVGERLRLVAMHRVVKESVDFRDQAIDG